MGWLREKLVMVIALIRLIDIEPFVILYTITGQSTVATTQLIQDKICLNKYHQDRKYCIELSKSREHSDSDDEEQDHIASQILADVSQYLTWSSMIASLPAILYMLFIASWIDTYVHGRKILMCLTALGAVGNHSIFLLNSYFFNWDVGYCLLGSIPSTLVGGWSCALMTFYSYMANNSTKENRFLKFTSFEIATFIARPLGIYITGVLLGTGNYDRDRNLHNYEYCAMLNIASAAVALIYILIVINENKPKKKTKADNEDNNNVKESSDESKQMSLKFEFSKLIDIKNFKEIFRTAVKVRPNRGRAKIWLLYLAMCVSILTDAKFFSILFVYSEKVYNWNASVFSNVRSVASIVQTLAMPVASGVFSGYMKLTDTKLGLIGFIITSLQNICIGSIVHPLGLYLLFIIGGIASLYSLAVRSLLSKIAPELESGKIFALLGALEMAFTVIENYFLNSIFEFSIDFFPSLLFQMAAALNFIPIFIFYWLDITHDPNYVK